MHFRIILFAMRLLSILQSFAEAFIMSSIIFAMNLKEIDDDVQLKSIFSMFNGPCE